MPGLAYTTEVNKGSVNMRWLTNHLNEMAQQGWRLHTIFEQDKNTVIVFERPTPLRRQSGRAGAGRTGPGGPRVALLRPQTYMNEAGTSVGPARGALRLDLDHVLVVHDEIDLPFGEIRTRVGGGLAGHNGLKSLRRELGSPDFQRVRVGVGSIAR